MVVPGQHWSQDAVKEFERRIRAGGIPAHVAKDMGLPVGRPVFTRARSAGVNDLFLITGLFGDALKSLEADGIAVDDRSARLILDRFCDLYKAQAASAGPARRPRGRAPQPRGFGNPATASRGKQAARSAGRG